MKKKVFICIVSIILIIGIILIININKNNKKYEYTIEKLGEANYFLLMKENKYGIIDKQGNIIIDPLYDIIEMPNPSKDIFICKSNYNAESNEYNVQVFNSKKEPILYQYYIVEAIPLNNIENNGFFEKSVLKYKSEGLYGLIDLSGKKITNAIYESIDGFEYKEGMLLVKKSGKYGVININGAVIVKNKYDEITCDGYFNKDSNYNESGYIIGTRTDNGMRYGYIDSNRKILLKNDFNDIYRITDKYDNNIYIVAYKNGKAGLYKNKKIMLKHDYEDILYNADNDLLILQKASKQGVSKFDGTAIVPIEYDNIFFAGNYINAQKGENIDIFDSNGNKDSNTEYISKQNFNNNKYEIVSTSKDEYKVIIKDSDKVIENGYSYIQYLSDNYFMVQKDNLFGIIDDSGKYIIEPKYKIIQLIYDYNIIELINDKNNVILIDNKMKELAEFKEGNIYNIGNFLKVSTSNYVKYINKSGELVENLEAFSNNKLFAFCEKNKWGFKDKDGNIVVKPIYELVTEFNEFGFAGIKSKGLWGSIDENGTVIKNPSYSLNQEPSFINEYYKVDLGYGEPYYTNS